MCICLVQQPNLLLICHRRLVSMSLSTGSGWTDWVPSCECPALLDTLAFGFLPTWSAHLVPMEDTFLVL